MGSTRPDLLNLSFIERLRIVGADNVVLGDNRIERSTASGQPTKKDSQRRPFPRHEGQDGEQLSIFDDFTPAL